MSEIEKAFTNWQNCVLTSFGIIQQSYLREIEENTSHSILINPLWNEKHASACVKGIWVCYRNL